MKAIQRKLVQLLVEKLPVSVAMHQLGGKVLVADMQRARLEGKIAYLSMLNPQQAVPFKSPRGS